MATFLDTDATNHHLKELIRTADRALLLISPYVKVHDRLKGLLAEKRRSNVELRVIYGKTKTAPEDIGWLASEAGAKVRFSPNLHAKCYLNESQCIVTSLNLYDFSQVNNWEMGILVTKEDDPDLFQSIAAESRRIWEQAQPVGDTSASKSAGAPARKSSAASAAEKYEKLTTAKLAKKRQMSTGELLTQLAAAGFVEDRDGKPYITESGKDAGGEFRFSRRFGPMLLWPENIVIPEPEDTTETETWADRVSRWLLGDR